MRDWRTKSGTGEELVETVWDREIWGLGEKIKGGGGERNKRGWEKK